jgi:hypothetical protein
VPHTKPRQSPTGTRNRATLAAMPPASLEGGPRPATVDSPSEGHPPSTRETTGHQLNAQRSHGSRTDASQNTRTGRADRATHKLAREEPRAIHAHTHRNRRNHPDQHPTTRRQPATQTPHLHTPHHQPTHTPTSTPQPHHNTPHPRPATPATQAKQQQQPDQPELIGVYRAPVTSVTDMGNTGKHPASTRATSDIITHHVMTTPVTLPDTPTRHGSHKTAGQTVIPDNYTYRYRQASKRLTGGCAGRGGREHVLTPTVWGAHSWFVGCGSFGGRLVGRGDLWR